MSKLEEVEKESYYLIQLLEKNEEIEELLNHKIMLKETISEKMK